MTRISLITRSTKSTTTPKEIYSNRQDPKIHAPAPSIRMPYQKAFQQKSYSSDYTLLRFLFNKKILFR